MNKKICLNHRQLFFVLFFCTSTAFSQDTLAPEVPSPPLKLSFINESETEDLVSAEEHSIDSSLVSFHRTRGYLYDITQERNIYFQGNKLPYRENTIEYSNDLTRKYKFSGRDIRYYNLNKRFTEITYLLGPKKEQLLYITYTQNLLKGWSAGIDFKRSTADGFFQHQQYYQSTFDIFTRYKSPNGRYQLFAYYLRNRLEQEENGGIKDFNPDENTVAQPVYLTSAQTRQTDKEILLRQFLGIGRKKSSDSTDTGRELFFIGHSISYATKGQMYIDSPADSFYQDNFYDATATADSFWYQRWTNKFFLQASDTLGTGRFISNYIALGHEYFSFKNEPLQFASEGKLNHRENIYLEFYGNYPLPKKFLLSGYYRRVIAGDYHADNDDSVKRPNDMFLYVRVSKPVFKDRLKLFAELTWDIKHPYISDERKYTNHFIWYHEFKQVNSSGVKAGITSSDNMLLLSGSYSNISDLIYYDSSSTPKQFDGSINYLTLKLQKNFTWGYWHFDNVIEYRKADNEDIIHVPDFMTGHALSFEKFFFRSALLGRAGIDVRYVSSYLADRYMPALQEFYLQHTEETGGYVLADFFITFKIRSARFFAKMENVLSGIYPEPKFYRPDYPLLPRHMRFGVQLRFFD